MLSTLAQDSVMSKSWKHRISIVLASLRLRYKLKQRLTSTRADIRAAHSRTWSRPTRLAVSIALVNLENSNKMYLLDARGGKVAQKLVIVTLRAWMRVMVYADVSAGRENCHCVAEEKGRSSRYVAACNWLLSDTMKSKGPRTMGGICSLIRHKKCLRIIENTYGVLVHAFETLGMCWYLKV